MPPPAFVLGVVEAGFKKVLLEWDAEGKKPKPDRSYIQVKLPDSLRLLRRQQRVLKPSSGMLTFGF
jgi:hypothetical protein